MHYEYKEFYDAIATGYDELHGLEQDEKLAEFLAKKELPHKSTLIDVGCGTGRSARLLEGIDWFGVEPSWGLIDQATPDVKPKIAHGFAESLPFDNERFDNVLCLTAMQNFYDPRKALHEMLRVCKPGGSIMISFIKKTERRDELKKLIHEIMNVKNEWEQKHDLMFICTKEIVL